MGIPTGIPADLTETAAEGEHDNWRRSLVPGDRTHNGANHPIEHWPAVQGDCRGLALKRMLGRGPTKDRLDRPDIG